MTANIVGGNCLLEVGVRSYEINQLAENSVLGSWHIRMPQRMEKQVGGADCFSSFIVHFKAQRSGIVLQDGKDYTENGEEDFLLDERSRLILCKEVQI